jgi:hypothetical protein
VGLAALIGLAGCVGENPVQPQPPQTIPATQPPAPAAPPAAAPPTPTPDPAAQGPSNHAPTVTLTGGGSCHPHPDQPCSVEFQAEARDRDGDPIRLEWHGCTSGSGFTEPCTIDRPGDHTATVVVTDAHGATARASATAVGTNQLPVVKIGLAGRPPDPAPSNRSYSIAGDEPYDPDDYAPYSNQACPHARATATGPCRAALALCGGVGDAFDIDVTTLNGPGTCVVEATVTDPWGAVGRDRFSFQVLAP